MKPFYGQESYVIHLRHYSETSVLLTCFTARHGKINLLAKGVRTPKSPMKALLQPFVPLLISFQGRGDLKYLKHCELHGDWQALNGNRIACGLYLNELLYWLLPPGLEHHALFDVYQQTLIALARSDNHGPALRIFEKHLLDELGYALTLTHDIDGLAIIPTMRYTFLPKSGARPVHHESARGILGKTLLDLAQDDLSDPISAKESQILLRPMIEHLLDGRPILSRAIWV